MPLQISRATIQQSENTKHGLLFVLIVIMSVLIPVIVILSFNLLKKQLDESTPSKIKEVHNRHIPGLALALMIYCSFLLIIYGVSIFKMWSGFRIIFYVVSFICSFSIAVMAFDAIRKIQESGKGKEKDYKQYVNALIAVGILSLFNFLLVIGWVATGSKKTITN